MYKSKRRIAMVVSDVLMLLLMLFLALSIIPAIKRGRVYSPFFTWFTSSIIMLAVTLFLFNIRDMFTDKIQKKSLYSGETSLLTEFIEKLRYCYTVDEFYEIISDILEKKADCSVLYINRGKNYVLYNSPNKVSSSKEIMYTLQLNFSASWKDGIYFLGDNYGIVSSFKKARGFFLVCNGYHFYVFCRYTKLFDDYIYKQLLEEFKRFQSRTETISHLSEIASLSQEWQQLADTQRSFLPPQMPVIKNLSVAAYYRPLVNVSGDYYTVLPITPTKTLLMLGDVSGKGLAAALVMGLAMNTVKILEDKDDLPGMIRALDKAIKGMKLQDKYTVIFIGIVDTAKMSIRYINASMSDPIIMTKAPDGYKIKPLTSNCSLVGIIDLPEVEVAEQRLFRGDVILMASDGVSEVMDDEGVELGTTELYKKTLVNSANKKPKEFVNDIVDLVLSYNGDKKLRDDVTMLVAKVE